ncbi:MAG: metalloregulator ArsR/SmtB family transcription factor [Planctomycetota bacterium]|nr:metalloregulator ArsR/SmtB family transcription factor [Planctomycetota bacterium]
MRKSKGGKEIICLKDNKVQCFNDSKVARLRSALSAASTLDVLAQRLKALGHKVRLQILELLSVEECCVCDLANILEQPVSTLSQHLKTLKTVGLVQSRQCGKFVMYSVVESELATTSSFLNFDRLVLEETP